MFNDIQQNIGGAYGARLARVRASFFKVAWVCLLVTATGSVTGAQEAPHLEAGIAEGNPGGHVSIPVSLQGGDSVVAAQFDLAFDDTALVPAGVTGGPGLSGHNLDFELVAPGVVRVVLTTDSLTPLNDGVLVDLGLNIAIDALDGDYPLVLSEVVLADGAGLEVGPASLGDGLVRVTGDAVEDIPALSPPLVGLLVLLVLGLARVFLRSGVQGVVLSMALGSVLFASTIRALTLPGDANDDGLLNIGDIPVIVAQILERATAPGDPDCNQDSRVDVLDTVCVVEMANDPPTLDPIADQSTPAEQPFELTASADDPDLPADTLAFSLDVAPAGMLIGSSNGIISWTPTTGQVGDHGVTVRVADADGLFDTTSFRIEVGPPANQPPTLAPIANAVAQPDVLFQLTVSADDPDLPEDTLTFSLDVAPAGMSVGPSSGLIEWTPTGGQLGDHGVTVRVSDQESLFATGSFTVTVAEIQANSAPDLLAPGNRTISVDVPFSTQLFATDVDPGETLTFSLVSGPGGLTVGNDGLLEWTPGAGNLGPNEVEVMVEDAGGLTDAETFTITVFQPIAVQAANAPPILGVPDNQTLLFDTPLAVSATGSDPDGDDFSFSLVNAPAGMTIGPVTGAIDWTPGFGQIGLHDVAVKLTDVHGAADFGSFVVEVRNVNGAPVANDDVYEARMGVPLTINLPGVLGNDTDPNDDALTAMLVENATHGTLSLSPDGSFEYLLEPPDLTTPVELELHCDNTRNPGTIGSATAIDSDYQGNETLVVGDVDNDGDLEIVGKTHLSGETFLQEVWIMNAADCTEQFQTGAAFEQTGTFDLNGHVGLLDIDGDGDLEIIGPRERYPLAEGGAFDAEHLLAIHHDGTLAWPGNGGSETSTIFTANVSQNNYDDQGPTFADLDGDGTIEIVMASSIGSGHLTRSFVVVYNAADGTIKWEYLADVEQSGATASRMPYVVDLDLDGTMEVIVHNSVIDHAGQLEFILPSLVNNTTNQSEGHLVLGIGNFDGDAYPELVGRDAFFYYLFEHDGTKTWEFAQRNTSEGQIAVADFDGDDELEFADVGCTDYAFSCSEWAIQVFNADGSLLWDHSDQPGLHLDGLSQDSGNITAFDANRDGAFDLVFRNDRSGVDTLYVFDGLDGSVLASVFADSYQAGQRFITVVDVNGDGHAEIINSYTGGITGQTEIWTGSAANPLPVAPPYRHQWNFHEAYVNDDLSIPAAPVPHWLRPGLNGYHLISPEPHPLVGADDRFTYKANDGALDSNTATVTLDILPAGNPPLFLSEPDALTTRGFPYHYAPIVVDPDLGDTVSFQLMAGPDGMTIDPGTGEINWLPQSNGSYEVSILALDTIGFATAQPWVLEVGDPVVVPDVIGLPEATAESTLNSEDLVVGRTHRATHPTIASGSVFEQTPIAGSVAEFGGAVDLMISLGPAPEDVDDDGDGFSENEGDCDDSDNSIFPGATDPDGDGIDQDCDGIDGNGVLDSIVITPDVADVLTDQVVSLKAYGIFQDGTSQNLTGIAAWTNGPSFSSPTAGAFPVTASRDAIEGSATVNVHDRVPGDDVPPIAQIDTPLPDATITEPVDVIGTASDDNFLKYELAYSIAGSEAFTTFASSTSPVTDGVLGQFDPTLLINDLYTIRLTVHDLGGNVVTDEVVVQVDEDLKVGNFSLKFTDLQVPLAGIPITVGRVYDSRDKRAGDFGVGWTLSLDSLRIRSNRVQGTGWQVQKSGLSFILLPTAPHVVSIRLPGGRVEAFELQIEPAVSPLIPFPVSRLVASYVPRPGTRGNLEVLENTVLTVLGPQPGEIELVDDTTLDTFNPNRFRYKSADGFSAVMSISEGVESLTDRNGNSLTITDAGVIHSSGTSIDFVRDDLGRITAVVDPDGNSQTYHYDGNNDLRRHLDRNGNETSFAYDRLHNMIDLVGGEGSSVIRNEFDDSGRLLRTLDAEGNTIEYIHDIAARTETVISRSGAPTVLDYDEAGNIIRKEDALGNVEQFTYDADGNQTSRTDAAGNTWTFAYDSDGNLILATDPQGGSTAAVYGPNGLLLESTDALGAVTRYEYDTRGNLIKMIDAEGNVSQFSYDAQGNMVASTDPAGSTQTQDYNAQGQLIRDTDSAGNVTEYSLNANGNVLQSLTTLTNDEGSSPVVVQMAYDANQNQISELLPAMSGPSTAAYDANNQLSGSTNSNGNAWNANRTPAGMVSLIMSGTAKALETDYDADDRPVAVNADDFGEVTMEYDALGNETVLRLPETSAISRQRNSRNLISQEEDELGNVRTHEYDSVGRRTRTTRPDGETREFVYDGKGRITREIDSAGFTIEYEYDALDRLIGITGADEIRLDKQYDAAGKLIAAEYPLGEEWSYLYNQQQLLSVATNATGAVYRFDYDTLGSLREFENSLGYSTRFVHDALGRLTSMTLPLGEQRHLEYDDNGRVIRSEKFDGTEILFNWDDAARSMTRSVDGIEERYTYDRRGRIRSYTKPTFETLTDFDGLGRLKRTQSSEGVDSQYFWGLDGRLSSLETPNGITQYSFDRALREQTIEYAGMTAIIAQDAMGIPIALSLPGDFQANHLYDGAGRALTLEFAADSSILESLSYSFDADGQISRMQRLDGSFVDYVYDANGRLISESANDGGLVTEVMQYQYDINGSLVSVDRDSVVTSYEYDANDRLISAGDDTLAWDANGNLVGVAAPSYSEQLIYDSSDRLVRFVRTGADPADIEYGYYDDGLLRYRSQSGQTVHYVWDRSNADLPMLLEETDETGNLIRRYFNDGMFITHSVDSSSQLRHYLRDHVGTVIGIVESGVVTLRKFDAYGRLMAGDAALDTLGFANSITDAESGLVFMRSRWFDPDHYRYISLDSAPIDPTRPHTAHRYNYANGDPVNRFDPSGQSELTIAGTVVKLSLAFFVIYALDIVRRVGSYEEFVAGGFGIKRILNSKARGPDAQFAKFGVLSANFNAWGIGFTGGVEHLVFDSKESKQNAAYLYFGPSLTAPSKLSDTAVLGGGMTLSVVGASGIYNTPTPEHYRGYFIGASIGGSATKAIMKKIGKGRLAGTVSGFWSPVPTYFTSKSGGIFKSSGACDNCESRYSFGYRMGVGVTEGRGGGGGFNFSFAITYYGLIDAWD